MQVEAALTALGVLPSQIRKAERKVPPPRRVPSCLPVGFPFALDAGGVAFVETWACCG